jgi:hypothetical protein
MYCTTCGSALPADAGFCPSCGRAKAPASQALLSDQEASTAAVPPSAEETDADTAEIATDQKSNNRTLLNPGTVILGIAGLTCLVVFAVLGMVPIFLIEAAAFLGLAGWCAVKWPPPAAAHAAILTISLVLAASTGVTLDQDAFGARYRYISQGNQQLRIDERAGRTDRLSSSGWIPIAFDRDPKEILTNPLEQVFSLPLDKGYWEGGTDGEVCFQATNNSGYVISRIGITLQTKMKDGMPTPEGGLVNRQVFLKPFMGGLISQGETVKVCASSPRTLLPDETWSYTDEHVYGWKR